MEAKVKGNIMSFLKRVNSSKSSLSHIGKIKGGGCYHLILIYDAPKFSIVYLLKWQVFSLQRGPSNSPLPPSNSRPPCLRVQNHLS